jgi:hypothetical protein
MPTMNQINIFIRNIIVNLFKINPNLIDSYLECYNNITCHKNTEICDEWCDKRHWFIKNVIHDELLNEQIFSSVINSIWLKCPNFVIDDTHYNFIFEYIIDCAYYDRTISDPDENPVMSYIENETENHLNGLSDKELLRVYYDYYVHYSMHRFIIHMDKVIEYIKKKETSIRDAKRATIVLKKIPILNYDVISHIAKYICGHHQRIYPV